MKALEQNLAAAFQGDWTAARALEDEIDRCTLWPLYTNTLLKVAADLRQTHGIYWALIRAEPFQRAAAYQKVLKTVEAYHKGGEK